MTPIEDATVLTVTSGDGTEIGYWTGGEGPPLVLVHGLLGDHLRWGPLWPHLEPHLTLHAMDRRGRGASGDGPDYEVAREFEDVAAVVDAVADASGSPVHLLGSSGGASFSLGAASLTSRIGRLVLFEPPVRAAVKGVPEGLQGRLDALLDEGDREGVIETAYREVVGLSDAEIEGLRRHPAWPNRVAAAHTVPRELRVPAERMFDPDRAATVEVPTLVLVGDATSDAHRADAETVAAALANATLHLLEGQGHAAEIFAPGLVAGAVLPFLGGG